MLDRLQDERTGKPLETSENLTEILALNNQMSEHYAKAQQARIMLIKIQNGDFDEFD
jgi:adenylate kinase